MISKNLQIVTAFLASLSLILHIFNNVELTDGIKLFYIPTILSFILSLICTKVRTKLQILIVIFISGTLLSSLFSNFDGAIYNWVTLLMIIGGCSAIDLTKTKYILITTSVLTPFALLYLLLMLRHSLIYRFEGAYNDPNYLCTTLLVLEYTILSSFIQIKNKKLKIFYIIELIAILVITISTISRTGIICILMLLIGSLWKYIRDNKKHAIITVLGLSFFCIILFPQVFSNAYDVYESRQQNTDNFESATNLRKEISLRGVSFVLSNPQYWFTGIGLGAAGHASSISGFQVRTHHIDHNTITSCFTEQGVFMFLVMLLILYNVLRSICMLPHNNPLFF